MKSSVKKRPKLKTKLSNMNDQIFSIRDRQMEKITKLIYSWINNKNIINTINHKDELINLFYESLTQIYSTTSSELKKIYKATAQFELKDIKNLTFANDGKTLDERIIFYLDKLEEKRLENIPIISLKNYAQNMFQRLLINETNYLRNKVMFNKIAPKATIKVIEETGVDDDGICTEYIGEYPADEDVPEPPYHTNCECFLYYVEVDDEDDIHDLDLELEE